MSRGAKRVTLSVVRDLLPVRLDRYLSSQAELDLSRAQIQKLIADGAVTIGGNSLKKNQILRGGEVIELIIPPPKPSNLLPENIPLAILFEDDQIAVINKPAGLVVHPAPGNRTHTLANALMHHFAELSHDDPLRPGIIHRLDKDTSGLILVAKTDRAARKLRQKFAERDVTKIYHALVCGHLQRENGTIAEPIGRSIRDRKKMVVTDRRSREAVTHYRVLERFRIADWVEIKLETGRTHQIRVHFQHLHRPILGDPDYGGRQKWLKGIFRADRKLAMQVLEIMPRQALHAKSLGFEHPTTKRRIEIDSELPDDMQAAIDLLRQHQ